ncbi:hypothetical protein [Actinocorallia herbida]|nr:hypothetical protein [Actinocorallia herbida]
MSSIPTVMPPEEIPVHGSGFGYEHEPYAVICMTPAEGHPRTIQGRIDGEIVVTMPAEPGRWDSPENEYLIRLMQVRVAASVASQPAAAAWRRIRALDSGWAGTRLATSELPESEQYDQAALDRHEAMRERWLLNPGGTHGRFPDWTGLGMIASGRHQYWQELLPGEDRRMLDLVREQKAEAERLRAIAEPTDRAVRDYLRQHSAPATRPA